MGWVVFFLLLFGGLGYFWVSYQEKNSPVQSSGNITVSMPVAGQAVERVFTLSGQARVFENVVSLRIRNKKTGKVYVQSTTMADANDVGQFGAYTYIVRLPDDVKNGEELEVMVFQNSAKDGSEIDVVRIPVLVKGTSD
jgi:hypothetical protein